MLRFTATSVLLGGALSAAAALAAPIRPAPAPVLSIASVFPVLEPGARVLVTWPAPEGFDEMELVLSVDGGRTFPLRVTRRIAPSDGGFSWTVPSLPAARARLALRAGDDEEEDAETIVGLSEEFAIAAPAQGGIEELFRVGREERTREALEEVPAPQPDSSLAGSPSLVPGPELPDAAGPESSPQLACTRVRAKTDPGTADAGAGPPAPNPSRSVAAIRLPMRI